jgi:hypothetical protein
MKITPVKKIVEGLLVKWTALRDSDRKLIANVWGAELVKFDINPDKISARELLKIIGEGRLSSSESITRARRKAEEDKPELRGDTWERRQGIEQTETKNDLKEYRK